MNQYGFSKSFYDWCIENNRQDLLDRWDYELNDKSPKEIGFTSNLKYWFKCPRNIHKSELHQLSPITNKALMSKDIVCNKCKSIGQFFIDTYGEEIFNKIWSDKNTYDPFELSAHSLKRIWLRCLKDETHPDYDVSCDNATRTIGCPYCIGRKVCLTNSLGYNYPEILNKWSDKNEKTPYDYTTMSNKKVWFKCENGIHDDYKRGIDAEITYNMECPKCNNESNILVMANFAHSHIKDKESNKELQKARNCKDYRTWRENVLQRDDGVCQCCGIKENRMCVHHMYNFYDYKDLRYDLNNGITLCENCHSPFAGHSFHDVYGLANNTPEQLEEYINNRRKELGIDEKFSMEEYLNGKILKPIKKD